MVGERGVTRTALDPRGQVAIHGEIWQGETDGETIAAGTPVVVTSMNGLLLVVTPTDEAEAPETAEEGAKPSPK